MQLPAQDPFPLLVKWLVIPITLVARQMIACLETRQYEQRAIREQIATLPADEVLLRGSDQPTSSPYELLRVAQAGTQTGEEELLRAESRTE